MKEPENTKDKSYLVWGSLGISAGCIAYVFSGKVWFLIAGIFVFAFSIMIRD